MRLFLYNLPVYVVSYKHLPAGYQANVILTDLVNRIDTTLEGHILVSQATPLTIDRLLAYLEDKKLVNCQSLTLVTHQYKYLTGYIKSHFKVIKAGGGLVRNQNKDILLIKRLGKWDLPKGKAEPQDYNIMHTALREVEEECRITVAGYSARELCTTWHNYKLHGNHIIKKTVWFTMLCLSDYRMKPQKEEDITDVVWADEAQTDKALLNSYPSIVEVVKLGRLIGG